MENNHKYILLRGEVIFRGSPVKIPNTYYDSAYFTLKCTLYDLQRDGSYKETDDYFNIHTYKTKPLESIREGYIVSCRVRRDGNLWIKDGEIVKRFEYKTRFGEKVNLGSHPIVFESYHLIGDIFIEDKSLDKESLKKTNDEFNDFLDSNQE